MKYLRFRQLYYSEEKCVGYYAGIGFQEMNINSAILKRNMGNRHLLLFSNGFYLSIVACVSRRVALYIAQNHRYI
jgi:hypothetical protein